MDTFFERLQAQLRDDIARMLPEDALREMMAKVVKKEFFDPVAVQVKDGAYNWKTVHEPSYFCALVVNAAMPIVHKLVAEFLVAHEAELRAQIKKRIDDGLLQMAFKQLDRVIEESLNQAGYGFDDRVMQAIQSRGLNR
jgi:hypothetical protein